MRCNADQLFEVSLRWRDSRDSKQHTLGSFSMAGVEHSFVSLFLRAPNLPDAQFYFGRCARPAALPCAGHWRLLDRGLWQPSCVTVSCRLSRIALQDCCGHRCCDIIRFDPWESPNIPTDPVVSPLYVYICKSKTQFFATHALEKRCGWQQRH